MDGRMIAASLRPYLAMAGGGYEQSNYTSYGISPSWLDTVEDPAYKKGTLYARMTYLVGPDDHKVSLFLHHASHTGTVGRPNRDFAHRYDTANLSYLRPMGDVWNLQLKMGYRSYDRDWGEDNYPGDLSLRERDGAEQRIFPSDLTFTFKHAGQGVLSLGGDAQLASYETHADVAGVGPSETTCGHTPWGCSSRRSSSWGAGSCGLESAPPILALATTRSAAASPASPTNPGTSCSGAPARVSVRSRGFPSTATSAPVSSRRPPSPSAERSRREMLRLQGRMASSPTGI